jgi:FecR-like protein
MTSRSQVLGAALTLLVAVPTTAWSQERVGVATTVLGPVTLARATAPAEPLKFKDDILMNDRITTGEKGFTRLLLGGKAVVTAREHSVLTIKEIPGTSTVDLSSGRVSVVVDKSKMRPGELVEIRTPNAVAGIRGTIVVAETNGKTSTISVLRGLVDVYRVDPSTGRSFGSPTPVGAREAVTVKGDVLPPRPQTLSVDVAGRLSNEFKSPPQAVSPVTTLPPSEETARARAALASLRPATAGDGKRNLQNDKSANGATGSGSAFNTDSASPRLTTTTSTLLVTSPTIVTTTTGNDVLRSTTTTSAPVTSPITSLTKDNQLEKLLRK